MNRNRYVPRPEQNLRATIMEVTVEWLSLLNQRVNEELRVPH
jgi:hypothetical protein